MTLITLVSKISDKNIFTYLGVILKFKGCYKLHRKKDKKKETGKFMNYKYKTISLLLVILF